MTPKAMTVHFLARSFPKTFLTKQFNDNNSNKRHTITSTALKQNFRNNPFLEIMIIVNSKENKKLH